LTHTLIVDHKDYIELVDGNFVTRRPEGISVPIETTEPLHNECQHFLDCIKRRSTPHTDGYEGLRVLLVLQACHKSLQLNGEPVQVGRVTQEVIHA